MMMKRTLLILCLLLLLAAFVLAQDTKETLALKRDLAQERVMRIQAELGLLKTQFKDGQEALRTAAGELEKLNASLKALESANQPAPEDAKKKEKKK